ncbi:hypothetical protein UCRPC4_g06033 [Phaeomoniella chlamydospora]|uniref:Aminotransferase n=1 Tax=Phaeomoniella chlamydospora TaxID=158046 RepID=A0A0G2DYT3_PHACM|nr:hypothetical protein UCRPC4_g06033 [Phaeomoniella chlamydospora]
MCGLGKTGKMHAWEDEGIAPDIQTIGKALGAGFIPLSGVLANQKIFDVLANGSGTLVHGHTFQAHPTACAAAVAVQKIIKRDNVLDNVRLMGNILEAELRREIGGLPYVGDIHGRGLFWAVEFMQDTAKMIPFDPAYQFSNRIIAVARDLGLNILGNLGKTGEIDVELVIICPPYIINANEVKTVVALLKQAVTQVSQQFASEHSPANGVA